MGWRDLCGWRHSFPRTKLLRKAGVRFIPEQRRGHWTAPGVETLLTLSCDKTSRAPILGVFFLSIAPFLPFRLFVHKQLHTCSFLSSILFFSPFPSNPRIYSFSLSVSFLRFVYYYPRHEQFFILFWQLHSPLPLYFSPRTRYTARLPPNSFPYARIPFVQYRVYNRADRRVRLSLALDMRAGTFEIASVQSFLPFFFFFCHSQSTQIISLDPRSKW